MVFSVEDFLKSPDASRLQHLTKDELFLFVTKFGLNVKRSSRKAEIRNVVVQYLVEEGILESSAMSLVVEVEKPVKKDYEFELQFKQLEIEQERERRAYEREKFEQERLIREQERLAREQEREYEKERSEREHEHALSMKQLEFDTQRLKREEAEANARSKPDFDVAKNIRLVPKFQEKDVDKYFIHFEKVAQNLNWPKEIWPLLLQSTFIGKAREIYGALSLHQSSDYDIIKENVLKAYELVPEAYRQKFRNYKKFNEQTHVFS